MATRRHILTAEWTVGNVIMAVLFLLLWRGRSEMVAAEEFVMVLRDLTSFIDFQGHRESALTLMPPYAHVGEFFV